MAENKVIAAGARYCGNKTDAVVHDLSKQTDKCRIKDFLESATVVRFERLESALFCGYRACRFCIGHKEQE